MIIKINLLSSVISIVYQCFPVLSRCFPVSAFQCNINSLPAFDTFLVRKTPLFISFPALPYYVGEYAPGKQGAHTHEQVVSAQGWKTEMRTK